jgi:hypothetical protein
MGDIRSCYKCGKPVGKGKRVCLDCRKEAHKLACEKWYREGKNKNKRKPRFQEEKPTGYTIRIEKGKWYWKHESGLENGPFDSFKEAKTDLKFALG